MRVLVCGSRDWVDYQMIKRELVTRSYIEVVIEGEAKGADYMGRIAAEALGIPVEPYPADWDKHSIGAGIVRNRQMLEEGKPDMVLAFHDHLFDGSVGTKHMVQIAKEAGVQVIVIHH